MDENGQGDYGNGNASTDSFPLTRLLKEPGANSKELLQNYIEQMLIQQPLAGKYSFAQAIHWLSFLAYQLQYHEITLYHVEETQPYWLSSSKSKMTYRLLGVQVGVLFGALFGALFGVLVRALFGALGKHFVLRYLLYRKNYLPWKLVPFLEDMKEHLLLRRVGTGYIFVHRELLDFLAEQWQENNLGDLHKDKLKK